MRFGWTSMFALAGLSCLSKLEKPAKEDSGSPPWDSQHVDSLPGDSGPRDEDGDGYLSSIDCDDQDEEVHPGASELCDGVDNDCDDEIDEADAEDATTWYADQDSDGYGNEEQELVSCDQPSGYEAVGGDCDDGDPAVNPDGADDCLQGVDGDCDGDVEGCLAGLGDARAKLLGEEDGDSAGKSVAGADADGDGRADLLVGAKYHSSEAQHGGAVYLLVGPVAGTVELASASARILGGQADQNVGQRVTGADLDGDGLGEILIGASGDSASVADSGAVYLVSGSVRGDHVLGGDDPAFYGEQSGDQAGCRVAALQDRDGDGQGELLIGAYGHEDGKGVAYVWTGELTGAHSLAEADTRLEGESEGDMAGSALRDAGDLDGDGLHDILVGASAAVNGNGAAYLLWGAVTGSMALSSADCQISGTDGGGLRGADAGLDANGDGHLDLLLGSEGINGGAGAAYLLRGPFNDKQCGSGRAFNSAELILQGEEGGDAAGWSVTLAENLFGG